MNKFYLGALALLISIGAAAQCTDDRYRNFDYFSNYEVIEGVTFGSNTAVGGGTAELQMDIYQPMGDTLSNRPVALVAFGGSFIGGNRTQVEFICNELTRLGYVAVAPDYRVGLFFPNEVTTTLAVLRGTHDMKACMRYLRKTVAENGNPYRIDPDKIFVGGVSAGAISAIHAAYFNSDSEIPEYMANDTTGLGGVEGNSGSLGYSSLPQGVFSMSGAIGDTAWIEENDIPIISWHEEGDMVVPYYTQEVAVSGIPTGLIASGSHDLHLRADNAGMDHCFNGYPGGGHVGFIADSNYADVMGSMASFLADIVCDEDIACGTVMYTPDATDNNLVINDPAGIEDDLIADLKVFPNPAVDVINVELARTSTQIQNWSMTDVQGRTVKIEAINSNRFQVNLDQVEPGLYFVSINTVEAQVSLPVVVE